MLFEPGDQVWLVHSGERATVVNILSEDMLEVDVEGIRFPVYADQVEFPYFRDFTSQPKSIRKPIPGDVLPAEKPQQVTRVETGLWLQFFPVYRTSSEDEIERIKIFLANETSLGYQMIYRLMKQGITEFAFSQEIRPFSHLYLHDVLFEDFNDKPVFYFQVRLSQPDATKQESYEKRISIRARELFLLVEQMHRQQQASFSKLIFQSYPNAVQAEQMPVFSPRRLVSENWTGVRSQPAYEVDLHADKLGVNTAGMSAGELLELQVQIFSRHFERAIASRQPHLKVIHGIGKGVLRDRIHEILRQTPEVSYFTNDVNPGVTQIYLTYLR
ncbi:Smr/MutS family protein [Thermoflavifilum thermophilum]|uniref:Smr domain-containing protein n=1 Tax=Thermoflavifilum thermophilum TaxID=1393122 RepID=A0A1I7N2S3_9BACT|nr:Smr/MutS family protein [Thermoflavifilum thermophilum]SFV28856.1 Smr domain-containing protein [Thermoflavifilum thermophilum]